MCLWKGFIAGWLQYLLDCRSSGRGLSCGHSWVRDFFTYSVNICMGLLVPVLPLCTQHTLTLFLMLKIPGLLFSKRRLNGQWHGNTQIIIQ